MRLDVLLDALDRLSYADAPEASAVKSEAEPTADRLLARLGRIRLARPGSAASQGGGRAHEAWRSGRGDPSFGLGATLSHPPLGTLGAEAVSQLTPQDRVHPFASAGTLLAQLHSLPVDERLTEASLSEAAQEYAHKSGRRLGEYGASALASTHRADSLARVRCLAVELLHFLPAPAQCCCVHGDFSMRNLLVSGADRLWTVSGLFDFERSEYGDAAVDLARMLIAHSDWSDAGFRAFLDAYASIAAIPSRERILLQLRAIILDASTWAADKDRDYYDLLLDVADRVATRPDSLPSLFQPSPRAGLQLSLPRNLRDGKPGQR